MILVGHRAGPRNGRDRLDPAVDDPFRPRRQRKIIHRFGRSGFQVDPFPVSDGEFPNGELIDHQALPGQTVPPPGHFAGEELPGGKGSVVVSRDAIQGPLHGEAEMFDEAGPFAPAHRPERIDVAETVAQHEHVGVRMGLPGLSAVAGYPPDRHLLRRKDPLIHGQAQHDGQVAQMRHLVAFRTVSGWGQRWQVNVSVDELLQPGGYFFHGFGAPVGIAGKELGPAALPLPFHQRRRRVEDQDPRALHLLLEAAVGGVLQGFRLPAVAAAQFFRMDHGLDGRRHDDQGDPPSGELFMKMQDRGPWVRLRRGGPLVAPRPALSKLDRIEKGRAGQVVDAGAVKEPGPAAAVGLLVACAQPGRQGILNPGTQPFSDRRLVIQRFLVLFHLFQKVAVDRKDIFDPRRPGRTGCLHGRGQEREDIPGLRQRGAALPG